ncbi:hypothetical protein COCOBI_11-5390 [Coccomyxa sp. Obi]|nr:hypothetical protein COCOBI_11-5390 [Coccomyxa sp. Obi]
MASWPRPRHRSDFPEVTEANQVGAGCPGQTSWRQLPAKSHLTPHASAWRVPNRQQAVMVRECVVAECGTHARFNHPGETHGVFCSKHKMEGMRNVVHKPCVEPGCATLAVFNQPGAGHGLFCGQHKPAGYVNVKDRKCQAQDCQRMPNFNFPGEKGGIFCSQHKAEGMVDIKHKRCIAEGCNKRPSFNYTGEMRALYCGPHKLEGMVNVDQERRSCNRAKFADGSAPDAKRQRSSYSEKTTGFQLKNSNLAGSEQAQPFDCASEQQVAALAAAYPGALAAAHGSMLVPSAPGTSLGAEGSQGVYQQALGEHGSAQQQQPPQQQDSGMQYISTAAGQGHDGEQSAHSAPLGFMVLPPITWAHQADAQQQVQQAATYQEPAAPPLPHLPSPADLRAMSTAISASPGKEESGTRNHAHLMHSHLVEFLREYLRRPELQKSEEDKARVCRFIEAFTAWDPATRVEQYALLHLEWELAAAGEAKWRAVAERLDKALAPMPVQAQVPQGVATAAAPAAEDQPLA